MLSIAGLAFSPQMGAYADKWLGPHSWGLNSSVLIFMALFWMLFEFSATIANAVYVALINDVVPQEVLGRFFGLFRALSLVAGIISPTGTWGKAETAYVWIFLGIGAIYGIGVTLMCLKVKEGEYPPQLPMDSGRNIRGFLQAAKNYFVECFGNTYYWWLFGSFTLAAVGIGGPVNLFSVFFAKSVHMDLNLFGNCLALTYCFSLGLAYPLGWLAGPISSASRRNGCAMALYAIVSLWAEFLPGTHRRLRSRWWPMVLSPASGIPRRHRCFCGCCPRRNLHSFPQPGE